MLHELEHASEEELAALLAYLRALRVNGGEKMAPLLAAESSLAKDWLTPEEEVAWKDL